MKCIIRFFEINFINKEYKFFMFYHKSNALFGTGYLFYCGERDGFGTNTDYPAGDPCSTCTNNVGCGKNKLAHTYKSNRVHRSSDSCMIN